MKLGIMQPYFFPYIGYWQLIDAVDEYVIYDDVNFIKGGWINRNRILNQGKVQYFNVYLEGASSNKRINEVKVEQNEQIVNKNLRILEAAYKKAPYFEETMRVLCPIIKNKNSNLAEYLCFSLLEISQYLQIDTQFIQSSKIVKNNALKGQDKVIEICKIRNADTYLNAIGGKELYSQEAFAKENISLKFVQTELIVYKQFDEVFEPNLSIIDMMMFNSVDNIKQYLKRFQLR